MTEKEEDTIQITSFCKSGRQNLTSAEQADFVRRFKKFRLWVFLLFTLFGALFFAWDKIFENPVNLSSGTFWIYGISQFISIGLSIGVLFSLLISLFRLPAEPKNGKGKFRKKISFFLSLLSAGKWINLAAYGLVYLDGYRKALQKRGHGILGDTEQILKGDREQILQGSFKATLLKLFELFRNFLTVKITQYNDLFPNSIARRGDEGRYSIRFWLIISVVMTVGMFLHALCSGYHFCWMGRIGVNEEAHIEKIVSYVSFPLRAVNRLLERGGESDTSFIPIPDRDDIRYLILNAERRMTPDQIDFDQISKSRVCWLWFLIASITFYAVIFRLVYYFFFVLLVRLSARRMVSVSRTGHLTAESMCVTGGGGQPIPSIPEGSLSSPAFAADRLLACGCGIDIPSEEWPSLLGYPESLYFDHFGNILSDVQFTELKERIGQNRGRIEKAVVLIDINLAPTVDLLSRLWNNLVLSMTGLQELILIYSCGDRLRRSGISAEEKISDWKRKISSLSSSFELTQIDRFDHETVTFASRVMLHKVFYGKFSASKFSLKEMPFSSDIHSRFPYYRKYIVHRLLSFQKDSKSDDRSFTAEEREELCRSCCDSGTKELRRLALLSESEFQKFVQRNDSESSLRSFFEKGGNKFRQGVELVHDTAKFASDIKNSGGQVLLTAPLKKGKDTFVSLFHKTDKQKEDLEQKASESVCLKKLGMSLTETALVLDMQGADLCTIDKTVKESLCLFGETGILFDIETMESILEIIQRKIGC